MTVWILIALLSVGHAYSASDNLAAYKTQAACETAKAQRAASLPPAGLAYDCQALQVIE